VAGGDGYFMDHLLVDQVAICDAVPEVRERVGVVGKLHRHRHQQRHPAQVVRAHDSDEVMNDERLLCRVAVDPLAREVRGVGG